MDNGFQVVQGSATRVAGAGSQAGPTLIPGNWYTFTYLNPIRIVFADQNAAAPTATSTSPILWTGQRWDFVPKAGQEKCAIIDAAGGTVEASVMITAGGG